MSGNTVLDLEKGTVVDEVPIPGCFSIILSADAKRFTSICGDGTLLTVKLGDNGKAVSQVSSDKIFDVDADPLFIHTQRFHDQQLLTDHRFDLLGRNQTAGDSRDEHGKTSS